MLSMALEEVDSFDGVHGFPGGVCCLNSGDSVGDHLGEEITVTEFGRGEGRGKRG